MAQRTAGEQREDRNRDAEQATRVLEAFLDESARNGRDDQEGAWPTTDPQTGTDFVVVLRRDKDAARAFVIPNTSGFVALFIGTDRYAGASPSIVTDMRTLAQAYPKIHAAYETARRRSPTKAI